MQRIKAWIGNSLDKLGERTKREKLLVALTVLVLIFILWHMFVYQGQSKRLQDLKQQFNSAQEKVASLRKKQSRLSEQVDTDKQKQLRKQVNKLQEDISDLDAKLRRKTGELISPQRMTRELRRVMQSSSELQLMQMSNHPPEKVSLDDLLGGNQDIQSSQLPEIYRHPLTMSFRGSYFQALRSLKSLEDISSSFFWDKLTFQVLDHPKARLRLQVHTLSLEKQWLGF